MKKITSLILLLVACFVGNTISAQNPGYRYVSGQYKVLAVDTATDFIQIAYKFKFYVDASAVVTLPGGTVDLSVVPMDTVLEDAVFVNLGGFAGPTTLDVETRKREFGIVELEARRIQSYALSNLGTNLSVLFFDFPRTSLPLVGLSDANAGGFIFMVLEVPLLEAGAVGQYDSPVVDPGINIRRAIGEANVSIQLDATNDNSVSFDSYQVVDATNSGLITGLTKLEGAGVTDLALNTITGEITFSTIGATAGRYPIQVAAIDDRGGTGLVDFIIELVPCNTKPSFAVGTSSNANPYDVPIGSPFTLDIYVDRGDATHPGTLVQIDGASFGDISYVSTTGTTDRYLFSWTPTAGSFNTNLTVTATDTLNDGSKTCSSNEITFQLRPIEPCQGQLSASLTVEQPLVLPAGYDPNLFYNGTSIGIDASAVINGAAGLYSYEWAWDSNPGTIISTSSILDDEVPPAGATALLLNVKDQNTAVCAFDTIIDIPFGNISPACSTIILVGNCSDYGDSTTFYKGYSTGFDLTAIGDGPTEYDYLWSTGDTTQHIFVVPNSAGDYWVQITDSTGCVSSDTVTIYYEDLTAGCWDCDPIIQMGGNNGNCNNGNGGGNNNCNHNNCSRRTCHHNNCNNHACHHNNNSCGYWWCNNNHPGGNCTQGNCGNNGNNGGKKMTICHIPPGNPGNAHTITIGQNAWPAHEAHGCLQGSCDGTYDNCDKVKYPKKCRIKLCKINGWGCWNGPVTVSVKAKDVDYYLNCGNYTLGPCTSNKTEPVYEMLFDMNVMPNPTTDGRFTLNYQLFEATQVEITVVDYMGRIVYNNPADLVEEGLHNEAINLENAAAGIYVVTITAYGEVWTEKIQVLK